jgi:hypothetical protein
MRNAKGDSEKEKGFEKDKERDRNSLRGCMREKGKKLDELIRVNEKCKRRQRERKRIGKQ